MARVVLGVLTSLLVLGLVRAKLCDKDINMENDVFFEKMTYMSDAVVTGEVLSKEGRQSTIKLKCLYKSDDTSNQMITVTESKCPNSTLMTGNFYLMFLEGSSQEGYSLRYTAFEEEVVYEVASVCGIKRVSFADNAEECPEPEPSSNCVRYPTTPKPGPPTSEPKPNATPEPEPGTQKPGEVDVVVGGQEADPEGTNAATTNFLSCALSFLSFVMSLLML